MFMLEVRVLIKIFLTIAITCYVSTNVILLRQMIFEYRAKY
jgi:hypothetical protein